MEFDQLKRIITKRLLGEVSEDEQRKLEEWQGASEENRRLMERLTSEAFLRRAVGDRNRVLGVREWKRLEGLMIGGGRKVGRLRWLGAAVAVLVLGMGGLSVWLLRDGVEAQEEEVFARGISAGSSKAIVEMAGGEQFFFTKDTVFRPVVQGMEFASYRDTLNISGGGVKGGGEFYTVRIPNGGEYIARLEDGSVVHLNAGSELRVPVDFGPGGRNVWLKGEAFFSVAHDRVRRFTVHTNKADVSVLGTEFGVRAYGDEKAVVTTLVEGSVEVLSGGRSSLLKPGYQACVAEVGVIVTDRVDVYRFIAWKAGRMVFEDERLERIMTELQRWYDFEVFYANPEVKDMRFTIDILKYDDISRVLGLMEKMEKVSFMQRGRTVTLGSR